MLHLLLRSSRITYRSSQISPQYGQRLELVKSLRLISSSKNCKQKDEISGTLMTGDADATSVGQNVLSKDEVGSSLDGRRQVEQQAHTAETEVEDSNSSVEKATRKRSPRKKIEVGSSDGSVEKPARKRTPRKKTDVHYSDGSAEKATRKRSPRKKAEVEDSNGSVEMPARKRTPRKKTDVDYSDGSAEKATRKRGSRKKAEVEDSNGSVEMPARKRTPRKKTDVDYSDGSAEKATRKRSPRKKAEVEDSNGSVEKPARKPRPRKKTEVEDPDGSVKKPTRKRGPPRKQTEGEDSRKRPSAAERARLFKQKREDMFHEWKEGFFDSLPPGSPQPLVKQRLTLGYEMKKAKQIGGNIKRVHVVSNELCGKSWSFRPLSLSNSLRRHPRTHGTFSQETRGLRHT